MAKKKTSSETHKNDGASSAPELPPHVAKEYGLHHETSVAEGPAEQEESKNVADDTGDEKIDQAVDDIVSQEGDELLTEQDKKNFASDKTKPKKFQRLSNFFKAWWANKWVRYGTLAGLVAVLMLLAILPTTRYAALNTFGVRCSTSLMVLDQDTQLPLKNVTVVTENVQAETNIKGVVQLKHLKLGAHTLTIKRLAFAPQTRHVVLGWGSNPLGTFQLHATGVRYSLFVTDYLSGKPLATAEGVNDDLNAVADKQGKITLTVDNTNASSISVAVQANGYRSETITLNANTVTTPKVALVPAQKEVFISKKSGKYDLYAIDVDGKDKQLLLAGTGLEDSNISLVTNSDDTKVALVSKRDNLRDQSGYLLYALTIIDLTDGSHQTVDHSQVIMPISWNGNRLVYETVAAGASAANPQRTRVVAYNTETNSRSQLATANYFNFATSINDFIYYAASDTDPSVINGLFKIKPDGTGRKRLTTDVVWTGIQTAYQTIALEGPTGWTNFDTDKEKQSTGSAPADFNVTTFVQKDDGKQSLWVDQRDGKGVLLLRDNQSQKDTTLLTQSGLNYPVYWAGDHAIVYRIATSAETADYVLSPDGGAAHKITDVTATRGYNTFYY